VPRRRTPAFRQHAIISSTGITPLEPVIEIPPAAVEAAIKDLFAFVNHHQPVTADSPEPVRVIDRFLTALSDGWRFQWLSVGGFARWVMVAMKAVEWEVTHASHRRVRRCDRCRSWMFVRDPRRKYCTTPECERARARTRIAEWRRTDYKKNKTARHRVTTKRSR
jgi:hypothetical protein